MSASLAILDVTVNKGFYLTLESASLFLFCFVKEVKEAYFRSWWQFVQHLDRWLGHCGSAQLESLPWPPHQLSQGLVEFLTPGVEPGPASVHLGSERK